MKKKGNLQILPVPHDVDDLGKLIFFLFLFFSLFLPLSLSSVSESKSVLLVSFKEKES